MRRAVLALMLASGQAHAQTVVVYSRADAPHAQRAHQLASVWGPAIIDRQLQPGQPWRLTVQRAICGADLVLLLWSARAAASAEVRREIDTALVCGTAIQPVLLDDTPLPGLVGDVQAVDWR